MSTTEITEKEAMFVREGDMLLTDGNLPMGEGVLSFAFKRDRDLRRMYREAGYPATVRVTSKARRVPDEPSDVEFDLDFAGQTYTLNLHCERVVRVAK